MFTRRSFPGLALAAILATAAAFLGVADAQTASATKTAGSLATLTWTAPVTNTDGTPIAGAVTYNVYQGGVQVATGLSALTWTSGALTIGTVCWTVSDTVAGVESAQSPQICASVVAPTPNPPAGLTVR